MFIFPHPYFLILGFWYIDLLLVHEPFTYWPSPDRAERAPSSDPHCNLTSHAYNEKECRPEWGDTLIVPVSVITGYVGDVTWMIQRMFPTLSPWAWSPPHLQGLCIVSQPFCLLTILQSVEHSSSLRRVTIFFWKSRRPQDGPIRPHAVFFVLTNAKTY